MSSPRWGPRRDRCVRMIASERRPRSERVSVTLRVDCRFGITPAHRERFSLPSLSPLEEGNTPAGLRTACVFALRRGSTERMLARPLVDFRRRRLPLGCTPGGIETAVSEDIVHGPRNPLRCLDD